MPNTLVHIGLQSVATRRVVHDVDPKWIYVGCILPDVPWIFQRAVLALAPSVDPVALRYYVDAQGSLALTLFLCGAVGVVASASLRVFLILALNAAAHLLLDALEIKWANGVHLLAPFSWDYVNVGVVWPDSLVVHFLTGFGILVLVVQSRESVARAPALHRPAPGRLAAAGLLLLIYFSAPPLFADDLERANVHFLRTLTSENRTGQYVEFDRVPYVPAPGGGYLRIRREALHVEGLPLQEPANVSARGVFASDQTVTIKDYREHPSGIREGSSILGLGWVLVLWASSTVPAVRRRMRSHRA